MPVVSSNLSPSAKRRLLKEFEMINNETEQGLSAEFIKTQEGSELLDQWNIYIDGQPGTLFEGYRLQAKMVFPSQYPYHPPSFVFVSPIFHPNVYADGKVCISILQTDQDEIIDNEIANCTWTPGLNVRTVCISIISLLNEPNIFSPANIDASNLFRDDKEKYEKMVKEQLEKSCKKLSK
jgi:ubiquitin-conjugating enzyme E2 R